MVLSKTCIFNESKICNDCGECYICELDRKKKCNNCGKCLEMEGIDIKAIKIEEIMEEEEYIENEELEDDGNCSDILTADELTEDNPVWEYIDDIKDLKQLMDDSEEEKEGIVEAFPGLIQYKASEKEDKE